MPIPPINFPVVSAAWMTWALRFLDGAIIAWVFFKLLAMLRATRAMQLLKGLAVIYAALFITDKIGLTATNWILQKLTYMLMVAVPIVFFPELRRALEKLGQGWSWNNAFLFHSDEDLQEVIHALAALSYRLSERRCGALIVLARNSNLGEYAATGTQLMAELSPELLETIFFPQTPLHDGAVILKGKTIMAAGCWLPLSDRSDLPQHYGTRHRAAAGLAEQTDALIIVVSEESGQVSLASDGVLLPCWNAEELERRLYELYRDYVRRVGFLSFDDIGMRLKGRAHV